MVNNAQYAKVKTELPVRTKQPVFVSTTCTKLRTKPANYVTPIKTVFTVKRISPPSALNVTQTRNGKRRQTMVFVSVKITFTTVKENALSAQLRWWDAIHARTRVFVSVARTKAISIRILRKKSVFVLRSGFWMLMNVKSVQLKLTDA